MSSDAFAREEQSIRDIASKGVRTEGIPRLKEFKLQKVEEQGNTLTAYACVDFSEVRVLNREGADITPKSRVNEQTSLATFKREDGRLVLDEDGSWSGASIC